MRSTRKELEGRAERLRPYGLCLTSNNPGDGRRYTIESLSGSHWCATGTAREIMRWIDGYLEAKERTEAYR